MNIIFGDISNESVLNAVEAGGAKALVVTFSDPRIAIDAASKARMINPDIEILARASSSIDQVKLEASEIDLAIIDEQSSARVMVELSNKYATGRAVRA